MSHLYWISNLSYRNYFSWFYQDSFELLTMKEVAKSITFKINWCYWGTLNSILCHLASSIWPHAQTLTFDAYGGDSFISYSFFEIWVLSRKSFLCKSLFARWGLWVYNKTRNALIFRDSIQQLLIPALADSRIFYLVSNR